jgi:hypothetical protein
MTSAFRLSIGLLLAFVLVDVADAAPAGRSGALSLRVRVNESARLSVAPRTTVTLVGWTPLVTSLPEPLASMDARVRADDFPPEGLTAAPGTAVDQDLLVGQFLIEKNPAGFAYRPGFQQFGPLEFQNGSPAPAGLIFQCGGAGKVAGFCVFTLTTLVSR